MSVTMLNPTEDVGTSVPVESPVEAIDLVAEQLDIASRELETMLDSNTLLENISTLRRGYGNKPHSLPVQFAVIEIQALNDGNFQLPAGVFADMLCECWLLASEEEPTAEELAFVDQLVAA